MVVNYYDDIIEFLEKKYNVRLESKLLKIDNIFQKIGSYNFIKIVVELENYYDIEFDDNMLNLERYQCLDDFINYTVTLLVRKYIDKP